MKIEKNSKWIVIIIALLVFALASTASALTITGKGCNNKQVCDTKTECDLAGNCNTEYSNCVPCGVTSTACREPSGIAYCDNTCEVVGVTAQCKPCTPDCSYVQIQIPDPHVILKFSVFTKKNFITAIEPATQTALAGSTVNYKLTLENKHPKSVSLKLAAQVPDGWSTNLNQDLQLGANSKRDVTFTVTSNSSASEGSYVITAVAFSYELAIFDRVNVGYSVAMRGAPSITIEPSTQEGAPGKSLSYSVTVTNNDPEGFDPSTISLSAVSPKNWTTTFDKSSWRLKPGESSTSIMTVKSPEEAEIDVYTINVNATANQLSSLGFASYKLSFCGNGVCELDENCGEDCISETDLVCNGRCEKEVDDGVEFSADVSFDFTNFLACKKGSKPSDCLSAYENDNCGYGKNCLCGSESAAICLMRCVDSRGSYYLYAKDDIDARTNSNYSFACPFVNLPELKRLKNNMTKAKEKYEQARSLYNETIKMNVSERVKLQPCIDALNMIIKNLTTHVSYMQDVINYPAKSNTTQLRRVNTEVKNFIEVAYNKYCRGAEGLLRIESITPPSTTEKGRGATANVVVTNMAPFDYYGYLECDFLPPGGQKIVTKEECTPIAAQESKAFFPSVNASYDGEWKMRCRVYASLESDCSTEIHDETDYVTFNVYSKDIFVVDVSGQCRISDVLCSVRTNRNTQCTGCKIDDTECAMTLRNGTTTYFSCPRSGFYSRVVGYVYSSSMCEPLSPVEKNITVHCTGCGDNITQSGEQCELPDTNNNRNCLQTELSCDDRRSLYRDRYGFCTPSCQCSPDQFTSVCVKGGCNATCSDGETKNKTITTNGKTCRCIQECNSECVFDDCYCEPEAPPEVPGAGYTVEVLDASVSDSCPTEGSSLNVLCTLSKARVDCIRAKVGNTMCMWGDNSYWYGNTAVFTNCATGPKTSTACGAGSRNVTCYIDITQCNKTGTDKTVGIDVLQSAVTPISTCSVMMSNTCFLDPVENNYVVSMNVEWTGGSYAKVRIENNDSSSYTANTFTHTKHVASSGTKQVSASVYNSNGTVVCSNSSTIYCSSSPIAPDMTKPSVELLGIAASDTCPDEKTGIDVICTSSVSKVGCIKAKVGNTVCEWTNNSYWYGNDIVFVDCPAGFKTNTACGAGSRNVMCYIDTKDCIQAGANRTLGIDVLSATKPQAAGSCRAGITSKNCSYDPIANRYNIYLGVGWSGGSYATGEIENMESRKYTISNFVYSAQSASAGTKTLTANVYDNNDRVLCTNTTSIYCTPEAIGTTTITNTSVEILGASVSDTCPDEKSYIDVICSVSIPKVDCVRAKVGNSICEFTNDSYWYGNNAVFRNCTAGFKTNSACGNQSREVRCYIDKTRCSQIGSDKTIGIDVVTPAPKPTAAPACSVQITSKNCSYDPIIKRYTAALGVTWSNGDHAHGKIGADDSGSLKYSTPDFTYTKQFGTPGNMELKAYVHDKDDKILCYNASTIYCGAGNTTGIALDLIRHMPDIAKPGWIDVSFDIIPYNLIQNFEFNEYVNRNLTAVNRTIEGNSSVTTFAGPATASEGTDDYNVYTWRTNLEEGKNVKISYKVRIDSEGDYRFIAKAKFFDQEKQDQRNIFITSCQQTTTVFAKSPTTGNCQKFRTSCEAAKLGYTVVESCVQAPVTPQPQETAFDWVSLIIVIIIAAILAAIWVKREAIKERIDEWRYEREERASESR